MHDIYLVNNQTGMDFSEFERKLLEICTEHRREGKAFLFAFILYDFTNPQVSKMLEDENYWRALDKISGSFLSIFSLNYNPKKKHRSSPRTTPRMMQFLVAIDTQSDLADCNNVLIDKYFKDIGKISYPSILFFQIESSSIIQAFLVSLTEEEIEKSFLEMKTYFIKVVNYISKIKNIESIDPAILFRKVEGILKRQKRLRLVKKAGNTAGGVVGLVSSIRGLFSPL